MFKTLKDVKTALECAYLVVCITETVRFCRAISKASNGTKRKKRDRKKEIVIDFIDCEET